MLPFLGWPTSELSSELTSCAQSPMTSPEPLGRADGLSCMVLMPLSYLALGNHLLTGRLYSSACTDTELGWLYLCCVVSLGFFIHWLEGFSTICCMVISSLIVLAGLMFVVSGSPPWLSTIWGLELGGKLQLELKTCVVEPMFISAPRWAPNVPASWPGSSLCVACSNELGHLRSALSMSTWKRRTKGHPRGRLHSDDQVS